MKYGSVRIRDDLHDPSKRHVEVWVAGEPVCELPIERFSIQGEPKKDSVVTLELIAERLGADTLEVEQK